MALESENVFVQWNVSRQIVPGGWSSNRKRDGPVRCVWEERRASEHRKSAEPKMVQGLYQLADDVWAVTFGTTMRGLGRLRSSPGPSDKPKLRAIRCYVSSDPLHFQHLSS